ncbi:hypothetical protein B0T11DRAFT_320366 [Plectosphaerella cucumerina]|uniref:Uncharacterized protein n=1 Tax=Plectosphaerella cucumerina TaxID=40658 RepID=A0A8K0TBI9_9PEZI|nr:hypothetical protein B0T11DRAFT_320366 [Plectosphaerella cucumerina]
MTSLSSTDGGPQSPSRLTDESPRTRERMNRTTFLEPSLQNSCIHSFGLNYPSGQQQRRSMISPGAWTGDGYAPRRGAVDRTDVQQHLTRLPSALEPPRHHDFVIDLDPDTYGCRARELAVLGSCQPISFGDDLSACRGTCKPGQWCRENHCVAIQIVLDPLNCGSLNPEACNPGSVCINGVCQDLKLGDEASSCEVEKKNSSCRSGHYCWKGECRPVTVGYTNTLIFGTDPHHCGNADQNFCYEKEVVPMHIATDKSRCRDGEVLVSGVCWGDFRQEHHVSPAQQKHYEQISGQRQQHSGHRGGQKSVNYHTIGYHEKMVVFEHLGRVWEFGEANSYFGRACPFNSICCFGQCLSLTSPWGTHHGADSPLGGCYSCPSGRFCVERTCRPISIDEGGFGGQCGISTYSPNGLCVSDVVCVDLTPGDAGNCGLLGPCPSGSLCILDLLCGGFRCENLEICIENQCRNIVTNPSACGPGLTVCERDLPEWRLCHSKFPWQELSAHNTGCSSDSVDHALRARPNCSSNKPDGAFTRSKRPGGSGRSLSRTYCSSFGSPYRFSNRPVCFFGCSLDRPGVPLGTGSDAAWRPRP